MSCKRCANLFARSKRALRISVSHRFFQYLRAALAIIAISIGFVTYTVGCAETHAEPPSSAPEPDMTRQEYNASCSTAGCHRQLTKTQWVHAPTATGACLACHRSIGQVGQHQFEPTTNDGSSCAQCHTFDAAAESAHEPFVLGTCYDCHDPHGGNQKSFLVTQTTQELCAKCHEDVTTNDPHHPVNQGDCQTCHQPHQSKHQSLLVQSDDSLCLSCHQSFDHANILKIPPNEPVPAYVHEPMLKEKCTACHLSHNSVNPSMLNRSPRSLCLNCHQDILENWPLAQSIHGPFEASEGCTLCHQPHDSNFKNLLSTPPSQLCLTCHNKTIQSKFGNVIQNIQQQIEELPTVHEPVALGECTSCHNAHYSTQHTLLQMSYPEKEYASFNADNYAMCIECHDSIMVEEETTTYTGFRNNQQNLHFVHVNREKGRACGICHQPHAGSLPKLMREFVPFGPGGWNLPIQFIETNTGGSCLSACHELRSYDNSNPARGLKVDPPSGVSPAETEGF